MRWTLLLVALLAAAAAPALGDHTERAPVRCDGGFCQDGEHHLVDCEGGTCNGSARGFPTVVNPAYAESNPRLDPGERVLGTEVGGQALAYPVEVLRWFETVEDEVDGTPILATYCPLCGAGVVFERRLGGEEVTLYNSGEIWRNDLVLYDLGTESRFSQVLGEAIRGPLHGRALPLLGSTIDTWENWRDAHPDTLVMQHPVDGDEDALADYESDPYEGYKQTRSTPQGHRTDNRTDLHPKTRVVGLARGGEALAVPFPAAREAGPLETRLGDAEIVAAWADGAVHVYETGGRDFRPAPGEDAILDGEDQRWWVANGTGPDGRRLERPPAANVYWFAWLDTHPGTEVLNRSGNRTAAQPTGNTSGEVPVPGPGVGGAVLAAAAAGALAWRARTRGGGGDGRPTTDFPDG